MYKEFFKSENVNALFVFIDQTRVFAALKSFRHLGSTYSKRFGYLGIIHALAFFGNLLQQYHNILRSHIIKYKNINENICNSRIANLMHIFETRKFSRKNFTTLK